MAESERPFGEQERRGSDRQLVCVVAEVETTDRSSLALIRNVSDTGALLFVVGDLDVGDDVDMLIHTSSDPAARKITARGSVIRRAALDPARTDLWRWEIGVRFMAPLELDADDLAAITRALQKK